jgi:hypothetical protein
MQNRRHRHWSPLPLLEAKPLLEIMLFFAGASALLIALASRA